MKRALLVLLYLLLTVLPAFAQVPQLPSVTPGTVPTTIETAIPELSHPRSVVDNFFILMEEFASGEKKALESALRALDMGDIPEFSRKEQGLSLASKLYAILIRTKIDRSKFNNQDPGDIHILRSDEKGKIFLEKNGENWKFSKETVRNIPDIYYQVKEDKVLRGSAAEVEVDPAIIDIRKNVPEILTKKIFSLEYWHLISIFVALILAWLVRYICFYIFRHLTHLTVKKAEVLSSIKTVDRFVIPLAYICACYAFHFLISMLDLDPVVYARISRILQVIKIISTFLLASRAIDLAVEILELRPKQVFGSDAVFIPLIRAALKFVLFFTGIVLIAALFSINVTGLLAGLGIGGLALALAAKDTVENLFGSITVLIDRPFKVGDFISIEGVSGSVENIGLRSTQLRTQENSLVTIPNSKLISVIVDNLGARKFFRTRASIGVTYETKVETLQLFCESIRELLKNHSMARRDYFVNFNQFDASSLNILIQVSFQASSYANFLAIQEEFFINIIKIANHLGVEFAYPVQRQISDENVKTKEPDEEAVKKFLKELAKADK